MGQKPPKNGAFRHHFGALLLIISKLNKWNVILPHAEA
jgi:hypothetical protein